MGQAPTALADRWMRGGGGTRVYTGSLARRSVPESPDIPQHDLLAFIQSAIEWRTLVRMMWTELGKPPVPGFPASRVQQILAGELPTENGFFSALLKALTSRSRAVPAWQTTLCADCNAETAHVDGLHLVLAKTLPKWQSDALVAEAEADLGGPVTDREDVLAENLDRRPLVRRGAAVDPSGIESEAEFMLALKSVKKRANLSFRSIEELSKTTTSGWLPRATAADMLRRDTLPRAETLWAFTGACGLPKEEQDKWEAARSRLAAQHQARRRARELKEAVFDVTAYEQLADGDHDEHAA